VFELLIELFSEQYLARIKLNETQFRLVKYLILLILIIGFCILLRVILTVNNNTFCFATIDKVFYYTTDPLYEQCFLFNIFVNSLDDGLI
jgi:hypothetical protein